jgi:class 3 adenylate cyclase
VTDINERAPVVARTSSVSAPTPSQSVRAAVQQAPRRTLTTSAMERTRAVVDEVLARASTDGERTVSWARLVFCLLLVVLWPLSTYDEMIHGELSDWMVVGISAIGVAFSLFTLRRTRTELASSTLRTISIVADGVLVLAVLTAFTLKPPPTWLGVGRITGVGAAYFAILGAGIRLSRRGAVTGFIIFALGIGALMWFDESSNHVGDTLANRITLGSLLLIAAVFAWMIGGRTRAMVLEGAAQTLLAERARARLGAYVSEEVAQHALASDDMRLGGVRQEVAILFSDLRSFTSSSEKADPEQIVRELNEYFEVMVAAVQSEGGVVDKYIGDSIMAVFGAPSVRDDDAARAIRAAWRMEQALVKLNSQRAKRDLPPLRHGIGVHFGACVAGNIGTATRAQYTVIGDTVNVAARLESSTKDAGVTVLISDAAVAKVKAVGAEVPALKSMDEVKAKGREHKIAVHTFSDVPA